MEQGRKYKQAKAGKKKTSVDKTKSYVWINALKEI
jgi:hypothetical protein